MGQLLSWHVYSIILSLSVFWCVFEVIFVWWCYCLSIYIFVIISLFIALFVHLFSLIKTNANLFVHPFLCSYKFFFTHARACTRASAQWPHTDIPRSVSAQAFACEYLSLFWKFWSFPHYRLFLKCNGEQTSERVCNIRRNDWVRQDRRHLIWFQLYCHENTLFASPKI